MATLEQAVSDNNSVIFVFAFILIGSALTLFPKVQILCANSFKSTLYFGKGCVEGCKQKVTNIVLLYKNG